MSYALRWRKAITTSLGFHVVLLVITGYAAVHIPMPQPALEQYIELDMGVPEQLPASGPQAAAAVPVPETAVPVPGQVSAAQPAAVADDSLAVLAVDIPAVSSAAGNTAASGGNAGTAAGNTGAPGSGGNTAHAGASRGEAAIIPPRVLSKKEPEYPPAARQAALQGRVVLKVQILGNGQAGEIAIARSSGQELLDEAAVAAVSQWRFVPAREPESGRAVTCYSTVPVVFRLQ